MFKVHPWAGVNYAENQVSGSKLARTLFFQKLFFFSKDVMIYVEK